MAFKGLRCKVTLHWGGRVGSCPRPPPSVSGVAFLFIRMWLPAPGLLVAQVQRESRGPPPWPQKGGERDP